MKMDDRAPEQLELPFDAPHAVITTISYNEKTNSYDHYGYVKNTVVFVRSLPAHGRVYKPPIDKEDSEPTRSECDF